MKLFGVDRNFSLFVSNKKLDLDPILCCCLAAFLLLGLLAQLGLPLRDEVSLLTGTPFVFTLSGFLLKQALYALLGLLVLNVSLQTPSATLKKFAPWVYLASVALLVYVLVKGTTALGAQRWIVIGGLSLQPSEPVKLAAILALAAWFDKRAPKSLFEQALAGFSVVLVPFLLIFLQPDLGTSLVLIAIFLTMIFWMGANPTQILIILSPLIVLITASLGEQIVLAQGFVLFGKTVNVSSSLFGFFFLFGLGAWLIWHYVAWRFPWRFVAIFALLALNFLLASFGRPLAWDRLETYQQKRLTIFLDPESDPLQSGYNIIQSVRAVGSGKLFGQGFQTGHLTQGKFVPEQHTDFIFSSIAEEWGFAGSCFLLFLFFALCLRIAFITASLEDSFSRALGAGVLALLSFHSIVNIGMNIAILPVTGVPLPFVSYGGTSLWVCLFAVGIVMRLELEHRRAVKAKF